MKEVGFAIMMLFSSLAHAENIAKNIEIKNATIVIPASGNLDQLAIYFDIVNHSKQEDKLINIDAKFCSHTAIREAKKINDQREIFEIDAMGIPANNKVSMKPNGFYVACNKPEPNIKIGDKYDITVNFDHTGQVKVKAKVEQKH